MNIGRLLKSNGIKFDLKSIKNVDIYNIDDEKMLVVITCGNNVFSIDRKTFEEIDNELLPYGFCLVDKGNQRMYYQRVNEPNNFLRIAFDSTDKDLIYFGKKVLNNAIDENGLIGEIGRI